MEAHEEFFSPQFPSDTTTTTNINNATAAAADQFIVEDLFDFSNDDATFDDSLPANSTEGSPPPLDSTTTTTTTTTNSNFLHDISPRNSADGNFSGDLSVPYDELAELEWLSKFAEESFSSEDLQKMQLISGMKVPNDAASQTHDEPTGPLFSPPVSVPAKARSKRSRGPPCNWTSRLLVLSPSTTPTSSSASDSDTTAAPALVPTAVKKPSALRKRDADVGDGRRCLHCATDKTPQWRTGPMGPKTLCNACGVRYKSGRLVPEYRPAASPTFMLTKHSNSHRKVLELRRQKEMMKAQQQQLLQMQHHQSMMFDASSNGDDYLIHQHVAGPDFSHLI